MKTFIVYYHPEPQSFNGAMLNKAVSVLQKEGHEVEISNLHELNFNPTIRQIGLCRTTGS